jgi:dTDP-glucose 4,6-dehydratase
LDEPIPVYGTGENVRDWLYVQDHVDGLLRVLESGRPGETYLMGGRNECTNLELVQKLCQILDECCPRHGGRPHAELITSVADRPGHDFRYSIDDAKIRETLNWQPQSSFDNALRGTVNWYLNHHEWWEPILKHVYHLERLGQGRH